MIKGIDMQGLTQRTADYAKDVSAQLRQTELGREFAQQMQRVETEHEMESVVKTPKSDEARINKDGGGDAKEQYGQEQEKKNNKDEAERIYKEPLPSVGLAERSILDIEV
ncbi:MAG: hypothetical protein PHO41_02325 [Eubacteriales bacterium]|nr:hypothetical protein [Eubacteriales bacterium]